MVLVLTLIKSKRMNKFLVSIVLCLTSVITNAQGTTNLLEIEVDSIENVFVKKMYSNEKSSSFFIQIENSVPLHKHEVHAETVYIISGEASMVLNQDTILVKTGDLIDIPANTQHAVTVTKRPLKVLSVQSPEFFGKDRVFIKE
jgi:mannose-6-phosphate isomerase-like protein (cupin superfamily)